MSASAASGTRRAKAESSDYTPIATPVSGARRGTNAAESSDGGYTPIPTPLSSGRTVTHRTIEVQADMGDDRTIVPRKFATIDEADDEDGFWTDPE